MECCVEQLFRLPTTRILAWSICWLALLPEPIGITSCKPTPRIYPHDAQLDYFRIADNSELFVGAGNLIPPLVHPRSPPAGTIVKIN